MLHSKIETSLFLADMAGSPVSVVATFLLSVIQGLSILPFPRLPSPKPPWCLLLAGALLKSWSFCTDSPAWNSVVWYI